MSKLKTLNEMDHLKSSGFGGFYPRHGLKLLYWFANDFITFDKSNNITSKYHPERGDFDFHKFHNNDNVKLLPEVVHSEYYEVGNLNYSKMHDFPDYVTEDYARHRDNSNMDRIIISITKINKNVKCFERVYLTEHIDRTYFNRSATYRISKGLLKNIRNLRLEEFLELAGYQGEVVHQLVMIDDPGVVENHVTIEVTSESDSESDSFMNEQVYESIRSRRRNRRCECTIL